LVESGNAITFVEKKMNNNVIQRVLDDDSLLEQFTELLIDEINNDDEAMDKKGRQLLNLFLIDDNADDFFIAICGWSIDSLLQKLKM
jgi:hypothetical protein